MLNEEKVRYMTGLAIFEKNEGRKIFPINRYFKKDYVGGQMFRSFFGYTFCYLLMLLLWVLYKLDVLLGGMSIEELLECGRNWGILYVGGLVFYLFVTWIVYSRRYDYASRSQTMYASRLRHLSRSTTTKTGPTGPRTTEEEGLDDKSSAMERTSETILQPLQLRNTAGGALPVCALHHGKP